jgi:predicted O-methyltransferase YrrM
MSCVMCCGEVREEWFLGKLPPSDTFSLTEADSKRVACENLSIGVCVECGLTQNTEIVSESVRYEETNYAYNSANSDFAKDHWQEYVTYLSAILKSHAVPKVLEIGSNDGYCASILKNSLRSSDIYGMDASGYQTEKAAGLYKGITFKKCIFGLEPDNFEDGSFQLIFANNVVNHANNLRNFLSRAAQLLEEKGHLVFEVPLLDSMFLNQKWDQIYHEHVSYFSINSLMTILPKVGFSLSSLELINYHGGSARVTCRKSTLESSSHVYGNISEVIKSISLLKYKAEQQKRNLVEKIKEIKINSNAKIYFFGAPAKGVTFINYCGLNCETITGCLENSPDKIGKFIPHAGIPIIDEVNVEHGAHVINLLWNIPNVYEGFCKRNNLEEITI